MTRVSAARYKLLVFDWDGTLEDSVGHITNSIHRALVALELPAREPQAIRDTIGMSIENGLAHLYPDLDPFVLAQAVRRQAAKRGPAMPQALFPRVPDLLQSLQGRGYWLAVATGKARRGLVQALAHHELEDRFVTTLSGDEARSKPHPEMLEMILDQTGLTRYDALMIGDSVLDLQMAANAGVDALAVSSGAHSVATLSDVDSALGCLDSVLDIESWLLANEQ